MRSEYTQLKAYLRKKQNGPPVEVCFEALLARANLLGVLEEAGVLPSVVSPNPFNPDSHLRDHDRWWREHPEERFAFCRAVENRQRALRQLHVGSFLNWRLFSGND